MADPNCLVSASLGLLVSHHPKRFLRAGDPGRQLGTAPGELAHLGQRNPQLVRAALVDQPARRRWPPGRSAGSSTGASSRDTVRVRRIRLGDNNLPSRAVLEPGLGDFQRGAIATPLGSDLRPNRFVGGLPFTLDAASLVLGRQLRPASLARALIARASARRVARLFRLRNRPIPALPATPG